MPRPSCASLCSRDACQDFTSATLYGNLQEKRGSQQPRLSPERRHKLCASPRSRNACQDFTRATLYRNLQKTMPRPRLSPERRHTFCASLHRRNACQDFTRATLSGNSQEKCRAPDWARNADAHFAWACAVEMHVHISQETSEEQLYTEIYRKNAAAQSEHPDQAPAFTPTVRTPQCGHTVWGINGMRRLLTTPNLSHKPPLYKIMTCGPTNQNHAKNSLSMPLYKVRFLGPPELVIGHMLAYPWFTNSLL